jgi:putative membrane protein
VDLVDPPPTPADARHFLAAERTLLAYVRTVVAMIGLGFVIARFGLLLREVAAARGPNLPQPWLSTWVGTALVLAAAVVMVLATANYRREVRRLNGGRKEPVTPSGLAVSLALLMSAVAVATAMYLLLTPL